MDTNKATTRERRGFTEREATFIDRQRERRTEKC